MDLPYFFMRLSHYLRDRLLLLIVPFQDWLKIQAYDTQS